MNPSDSRKHGEVVKLGPPASGEVSITVDPALAGTSFAAGTQTLLPGAQTPVQRHLDRDVVLFAYRGQGRASVNDQATVVVPGTTLFVPRGAWYGLRNTGTGTLQVGWVAAPPGLEAFYRDLARLGGSPAEAAIQELGQRHRVEFRAPGATPTTDTPRRHGERGGRRGRGRGRRGGGSLPPPAVRSPAPSTELQPPAVGPAAQAHGPASAVASSEATAPSPATSAPSGGAHRRRRGRRRGGRRSGAPTSGQAQPARPAQGAAPAPAPTPPSPHAGPRRRQGAGTQQRPPPGRHRRRVKEVYMDGRWVRVEGEAPVIAPSPQQRRRSKPRGDDEPPAVPFTVPI